MSINRLMNHVITVDRDSLTSNGSGGFTQSEASISTTVRGALSRASGSEKERFKGLSQSISHILFVPVGTDIQRGDKVTIDSVVLIVKEVDEPGRRNHHLECFCTEFQKGV